MSSRSLPLMAALSLGALLPGPAALAEQLRWDWTLDKSYQFEQSIETTILLVDHDRSLRNQVEFSQNVTAAARKISNGAKLTIDLTDPVFRATTRANRRNRPFDSSDRTHLSHPAWRAVQADLAALKKARRVATFDRKGRMAVVSGLANYPALGALTGRRIVGKQSEALLAFSTTFLPPKSVQPGDTWTVKLPNLFEEMLDLKEPIAKTTWTAEARFDKMVKRWNRDHARITYSAQFELASKKDADFPFARYTITGNFLLDPAKGLEVESELTVRYAVHPALKDAAKKERFWFSITSTAKQRLMKVKGL